MADVPAGCTEVVQTFTGTNGTAYGPTTEPPANPGVYNVKVSYTMQSGYEELQPQYSDAITWAAANGIVSGYGGGKFGPNDNITREQLATILWRYSKSPAATNKELHFNDADEISGYALDAIRWAVEHGILNGFGDGRLGPKGLATRAQVAQMLKNFIENQEDNI